MTLHTCKPTNGFFHIHTWEEKKWDCTLGGPQVVYLHMWKNKMVGKPKNKKKLKGPKE